MPWNKGGVRAVDCLRRAGGPTSDPIALPGGWSPREGQTGQGCAGGTQ